MVHNLYGTSHTCRQNKTLSGEKNLRKRFKENVVKFNMIIQRLNENKRP